VHDHDEQQTRRCGHYSTEPPTLHPGSHLPSEHSAANTRGAEKKSDECTFRLHAATPSANDQSCTNRSTTFAKVCGEYEAYYWGVSEHKRALSLLSWPPIADDILI
jgi:hypothetical protein